jgi:hypothetical protein
MPVTRAFSRPLRSRLVRLATAAAVCGLCLLPAVGRADTMTDDLAVQAASSSPAPSPSPIIQTLPGPQGEVAPRRATMGHYPSIDLSAVYTTALDYSLDTQIQGTQAIDYNATIKEPITKDFSVTFDRVIGGTLDVPLARVAIAIPGKPSALVYPGVSRDIVLFYHGTYVYKKYWTLDVGDAFRHREFNSGGNGVSAAPFPASVSSTEAHWAYAGLSYATHPIKELGGTYFTLTEQVQESNVDHNVGVLCTAANAAAGTFGCKAAGTAGVQDENPNQNKYYTTQQTVGVTVPLGHGSAIAFQDGWGALSWYENAPFPYRYSGIEQLVLSKRFSPVFTSAIRVRQYYQLPQGAPFPAPNVIHLGSFDLVGTFHIDTNSFIH